MMNAVKSKILKLMDSSPTSPEVTTERSTSCDETNGLILNGTIIPEEILILILHYVPTKKLLKCRLVCKEWNEIIKSHYFWRTKIGNAKIPVKNEVPWYTYYCALSYNIFNRNLVKNGNGEEKMKHWKIIHNGGDRWVVEDPPAGAHPLPENQPEFNGSSKCFATSFELASKCQIVDFKNKQLVTKVLDELQPPIYVSEWFTGRFDCACYYKLKVSLLNNKDQVILEKELMSTLEQWSDPPWSKKEILCENYGPGVAKIIFYHEGSDQQFWKGHFGSKMAGGVLKIMLK